MHSSHALASLQLPVTFSPVSSLNASCLMPLICPYLVIYIYIYVCVYVLRMTYLSDTDDLHLRVGYMILILLSLSRRYVSKQIYQCAKTRHSSL
jgi:hypothetical protein